MAELAQQQEIPRRLTDRQLAEAYAVCAEFGRSFDGIRDRVEAVKFDLERIANPRLSPEAHTYHADELAADVRELLTAVNPLVAKRILDAGREAEQRIAVSGERVSLVEEAQYALEKSRLTIERDWKADALGEPALDESAASRVKGRFQERI